MQALFVDTAAWIGLEVANDQNHHAAAVRFGKRVWSSAWLDIVSVSSDHEAGAWQIFRRDRDKNFGFVDCTSFAVMQARQIEIAFSFDVHFRQAGFRMLPEPFEG